MTEYRPTPLGVAFRRQLRAVGGALRREALLGGVLLAGLTVWALLDCVLDQRSIDYTHDVALMIALLGVAFPFGVWKGERLFGAAFLWTLPVDRRRHALVKAAAGWIWLVLATVVIVAWLAALSLVTGGRITGQVTRTVLDAAGAATSISWRDPFWFWLLPFTAGGAGYLLGTALVLGLKRPLWWMAAAVAAVVFTAEIGNSEDLVDWLVMGPWGLDYVISGGTDALDTRTLVDGEAVTAWRAVPSAATWLQATALWLSVGLLAVWIAASRHRER